MGEKEGGKGNETMGGGVAIEDREFEQDKQKEEAGRRELGSPPIIDA